MGMDLKHLLKKQGKLCLSIKGGIAIYLASLEDIRLL